MSDIIGIDLGTTNTVVARANAAGAVRVLLNATRDNAASLPSVVAFPPSGEPIVGAHARRRRPIDPENTIVSAKRLMGREASSVALDEFRKRYPHKLADDGNGAVAFITRAGPKTPVEIARLVLDRATRDVLVDPETVRAIVGVPAGFAPAQRKATIEATLATGVRAAQLVDEPIATAVANLGIAAGGWAIVFDIGGGTFDFAVVDARDWPFKVVGHGGDLFLGGDDFDAALARFIGRELIRLHGWDLMGDVQAFDRLVAAAERAKIALSSAPFVDIDLGEVDPDTPIADASLRVTVQQLDACIADLTRRTFVTCDEVLHQTRVDARKVDHVLLAGGTTLIPSVRRAVVAYFGREPQGGASPLESVALGAAAYPWRTFA